MCTSQIAKRCAHQQHTALRSAGHQRCARARKVARRKASGIDRMQPIDIFFWANCVDHRLLGNLFRYGKLHQNAMHLRVVIERAHLVEKRLLRRIGRQAKLQRIHTYFFCRNALISHIDLRGRVFADQYNRQARRQIMVRLEHANTLGDLRAERARNFFAVDYICCHARLRR